MILLKWRQFVCLPMVAILPVSLPADDATAAMLRSNGVGVRVNENPAPASIALFANDLVETQKSAVARIEAIGSMADINPETMVQFEGDELVLEHGSLSVSTSRGLRVRVGCVTVTPVKLTEWTHYDVTDVDGKISVSALKNDVNIDSRSGNPQQAKQPAPSTRATVREGERKSREEKCGAADVKTPERLAGRGAIMNSPWAKGAGLVGIGMTCWLICRGDDPISPTKPKM
ncbi:MAG: hypothetical protein WA830_22020 [Candidatus Sulfotelmatobacter sp.]